MLKNSVSGYGRITNELVLRKTKNNTEVVNFTVAINRGGENDVTDFIDCCLFGKRAEALIKNADKGSIILFNGKLQTSTNEYKGMKLKSTHVVVDEFQLFSGFGKKKEITILADCVDYDKLDYENGVENINYSADDLGF